VAAITSLFFPRLAIGAASRDHADIGQPAEMSTLPPEA
jgi:hypothetical protein